MYIFPWDTDASIQQVYLADEYRDRFNSEYGPYQWACEFLDALGEDIKERGFDGTKAVRPIRYSTVSGHGIGKGALTSWLIKFILDTRPFSKGIVTANTATQLKTKTWSEVGKWHTLSMTEHLFQYNSGRGNMSLAHREHKDIWRCDAITCREEDSEAFQGLHAANSTPFYIFDEASGISQKIWDARAGGATDGEPMSFDFGNPTRNSGQFFKNCVGEEKHRYTVRQINSRDVHITNKELFDEWLEDYGADSDWYKVKVLGQFPSMGDLQFIPMDLVEAAMEREDAVHDAAVPLLIGVDVARHGNNETVIYPRLGYDCRSFAPVPGKGRYRGLGVDETVGQVISCIREFRARGIEPSGVFVDGGGIGGAVIDFLRKYGYECHEVQFGGKPTDSKTYRFKVDEMWGNLRDALPKMLLPAKNHPSGSELRAQLTQREFGYTLAGEKINLESKADALKRLGPETMFDIVDALACTYAVEVAPLALLGSPLFAGPQESRHEFDPLDERY
ncbi:hypothetical protein LCGC14_2311170 [marine sediment metagenome]|uniref:Terminase large subunit gp17-like C-terminal domain-containing protein n=1 Tax=marine sediment metagenome TaxID=412755 RepID=A0A0F9CKN6_9ZZZZ